MGSCYASKTINFDKFGKIVKFEIWDTAGQEKYRSIQKIFYKDANAAILVYDITRKTSFEEIGSYWISQIKENAPKMIVPVIAANKSDMWEYEEIDKETGNKLAESIGGLFFYTSAKMGSGVEVKINLIYRKYLLI
jgi:small GTP-binding protein